MLHLSFPMPFKVISISALIAVAAATDAPKLLRGIPTNNKLVKADVLQTAEGDPLDPDSC